MGPRRIAGRRCPERPGDLDRRARLRYEVAKARPKAEFRAYAHPHFSKGQGWTYVPRDRHIAIHGDVAWFDEMLDNEGYGELRGTGALRRIDGLWRIVQYNLTFTIPNDKVADALPRIR